MSIRSGEAATVAFTLEADPDEVLWWVEDETGATIVPEAAAPGAALDGLTLTLDIVGTDNELPVGAYRGLRMVRVRYRAQDAFTGWKELETFYDVLGAEGDLVVQVNSFVTYNEALMLAREMAGASDFDAAVRQDRVAQLAEAWRALVRLDYDLPDDYDRVMSRVSDFPGADPGDLADMTASEFLTLDPRFVAAIKRAQVAEAIERLGGRSVADQRAQGLLSSTIGETSQMYRSGRPLDIGISPRALRELRGYVVYNLRITRG